MSIISHSPTFIQPTLIHSINSFLLFRSLFPIIHRNWPSVTQQESITYPPIQEAIREYQDPAKADKITKIRRDLDETTEILVRVFGGGGREGGREGGRD